MKTMTEAEWRAEAVRRFGSDSSNWRFVCPSCKHEASVSDWVKVGAPREAAAFSCVGRWMDNPSPAFSDKPGPCNYAGGGLFKIHPVSVTREDGAVCSMFDFAEAKT